MTGPRAALLNVRSKAFFHQIGYVRVVARQLPRSELSSKKRLDPPDGLQKKHQALLIQPRFASPRSSFKSLMDSIDAYLADVERYPLLKEDDLRDLARKGQSGCLKSRQKIVEGNLRLVLHVVKRHCSLNDHRAMDLIAAGNLGLMIAAERYDPDRIDKSRFSTYAVWWIRQRINIEERSNSRTIRLTSTVFNKLSELRKACAKDPCNIERAEEYGEYQRSLPTAHSLEAGEFPGYELQIASEDTVAPGTELEVQELLDLLNDGIAILNERELFVLQRRYGLDGCSFQTLDSLGSEIGVTRERTRQIEMRGLKKLALFFVEALGGLNFETDDSESKDDVLNRACKVLVSTLQTRSSRQARPLFDGKQLAPR